MFLGDFDSRLSLHGGGWKISVLLNKQTLLSGFGGVLLSEGSIDFKTCNIKKNLAP